MVVPCSQAFSSDVTIVQIANLMRTVPQLAQDRVGVRSQHGGRPMHAARIVRELDGETKHIEFPVHRMLDGDAHLLMPDLRIAEYFLQAHDPATGYAGGVQRVDPMLDR